MKILELFAGTRSIGKAFEARGHEVFSVEWDEVHENIDLYADISQVFAKDIIEKFGQPDVVWMSPDCTSYSIAAISHHRIKNEETGSLDAKSDYAKFCDKTNKHAINEFIKELNPKYWFIENPRGGMRKMDFMQELPRYTVTYCFAGETKIITKQGVKTIKDLVGQEIELLSLEGKYIKSPIREYGVEQLYKITLSRAGKKKEIYATKNHKWFVGNKIKETIKLKPNDRLTYMKPKNEEFELNDEFVARGFTFGDGWILKNNTRKKAFCMFVEDKIELKPYFDRLGYNSWADNTVDLKIEKNYGMPNEWKTELVDIEETPSNKAAWLAGYIASDGSVHKKSGQVSLSSSKKEDLEKVRDIARSIGIDTYGISEYWRKGYSNHKTPIYQVTFMKSDFPSKLLLRKKHKDNFINSGKPKHQARKWSVVSVEKTDRIEPVYCAEVPKTHAFTLDDGILTHNCQYGDSRMKPTDIWTNHPNPKFKPMCKNGDPCHVSAPRGSKTGTQGLKGSIERSRIPKDLCDHIAKISEE